MDFFDLHCDTPYECMKRNLPLYSKALAVNSQDCACFDKWTEVFAFWINDNTPTPWAFYKNMLSGFRQKLKSAPPILTPLFAVEGGALIETDTERLYELKNDGIRFITITWNGENAIAGGCKTEKGLTAFGQTVINKMNDLNIACDLSHLNEKSFFAALEESAFPLATHANCRALCDNKRNLSDRQIKLIAEKGGIMGLCFYPEFIGRDPFEGIYENIIHICDMGLEDIIAIGSDFDGGKMNSKLCSIGQLPALYGYLKSKGLDDDLLYKIFYRNAYNFVAKLDKKD